MDHWKHQSWPWFSYLIYWTKVEVATAWHHHSKVVGQVAIFEEMIPGRRSSAQVWQRSKHKMPEIASDAMRGLSVHCLEASPRELSPKSTSSCKTVRIASGHHPGCLSVSKRIIIKWKHKSAASPKKCKWRLSMCWVPTDQFDFDVYLKTLPH